ncbi:MAG: hypothetical protein JWO90_1344 [Solirubrobacterales bacterium]|jgi:hypothetical protein|nr:hypothetical protein [Solirubrobacterales bacterium]
MYVHVYLQTVLEAVERTGATVAVSFGTTRMAGPAGRAAHPHMRSLPTSAASWIRRAALALEPLSAASDVCPHIAP